MKNIIISHPELCVDNKLGLRRNYYLDNLKFALIILVVIGHFSMRMSYAKNIVYIHHFIYIFHMPCFIFVSGFFAKRLNQEGKLRIDKIFSILWMYLVFQMGYVALNIIFNAQEEVKLFEGTSAPWYLLALFVWYLCVPLIERIRTVILIPGSFIIGLLAGYITSLDDVFSLSRVLVFFPFFIIGFCLGEDKLEKLLKLKIRILAILFLIGAFIWMIRDWDVVKEYFNIVYGFSPYKEVFADHTQYGYVVRGIWYVLAILLSISFMFLIPRSKTFYTKYGERTMQVYMMHIWIRNAIGYIGFFVALKEYPQYVSILVLIGCIPLVFLLSNKWFKRLFEFLMAHKVFKAIMKKN